MKKHSVNIYGHQTSISLEEEFWEALKKIAHQENMSLSLLIRQIDETRTTNLSSALRVFALTYFQKNN